jgi:hypothetical protein
VPANTTLASITLTSYNEANQKSPISIQKGNTFTLTPANANANIGQLYGYTLFGTKNDANVKVGGNILSAMGMGAGAEGFSGALIAGNYTLWVQEFGTATYVLTFTVQANANVQSPVMNPPGGSFADEVEVTLTSATSGATIYYTLDGSTPTTGSTPYNNTPLILTSTTTVKAFAVKAGETDSTVTTEVYTVTKTPPPAVPTVKITGSKSLKVVKSLVKIKGTATNATSVTYQVGKSPKKKAAGSNSWNFTAKPLKVGKNVITIVATGAGGTATTKVTVTYKKKK